MPRRQKRSKKVSKNLKKAITRISKRVLSTNQEHKYFDYNFNNNGVDYDGTTFYISDIAQGDTDTTRVGDQLMPTSLLMNLALTVGDTTNLMRIVVVRWRTNVSTLAVGNIFTYLGVQWAPESPFHHDGRSQFEVLHDSLHALASAYRPVIILRKRLRLAKKAIKFSAGSTTASDKILLIAVSDSAAAAHPTIQGYTRLNFTDS